MFQLMLIQNRYVSSAPKLPPPNFLYLQLLVVLNECFGYDVIIYVAT